MEQATTQLIVSMIERPQGAGRSELEDATGWERHSIRGLVSKVMRQEMGPRVPR